MKKTYTILILILGTCIYAQVGISKNNDFEPDQSAIFQVDSDDGKAVILPISESRAQLPYHNATQPDEYDDDATYQGAIAFDREHANVNEYEGEKWASPFDFIVARKTPRLAHFVRNGNVDINAGLFGFTYAGKVIPYLSSHALSFNNIGITVSGNGQEFTTTQPGVYKISFKHHMQEPNWVTELLLYPALNRTLWVNLDVDKGSGYQTLGQANIRTGNLFGNIFNLESNTDSTPTYSSSVNVYLPAGAKVRTVFDGERSGVAVFSDTMRLYNPSSNSHGEIIFELINF